MPEFDRRDFLRIAPAAAGIAATALSANAQTKPASKPAPSPTIGSAKYTPVQDYPIQPKRHWEVALSDRFWKPRIATNASVTIPFQIGKPTGRGLTGNTLEAAMLSLKTHPDPKLQAQVDAAVRQLLQKPRAGNGGFEVAATRFQTTGQRDLLDAAVKTAADLHELIPYHLWANRGVGQMSVWLSTAGYAIGDVGPAGGYIFYENPNHATDGWRYLEAAPFDQNGGATWGCFRRLIEGARGTAVGTGKQNTADMLAACAEPGSAAHLCASLRVNGVGGWFLPSRDELQLMYRNLKSAGIGGFDSGSLTDNVQYWASSQQTADMAAHIDFADLGRLHGDDKDFPRRVRAIRAI